eukprot:10505637-Alexandrium_andersonii.AAC.1
MPVLSLPLEELKGNPTWTYACSQLMHRIIPERFNQRRGTQGGFGEFRSAPHGCRGPRRVLDSFGELRMGLKSTRDS